MPKLKNKKGVAKRFHITKKGKVKYTPCSRSHLLTGKEPERLRTLRKDALLQGAKQRKYIKRMLPYR